MYIDIHACKFYTIIIRLPEPPVAVPLPLMVPTDRVKGRTAGVLVIVRKANCSFS